jgi:hypothetical protein
VPPHRRPRCWPAGMRLAFALYDYFPFGGLERDCRLIAER